MDVAESSESRPKGRSPASWQTFWTKEMEASDKRLRRFRKQGNAVVARYLDKREGGGDDAWFAGAHGVSSPNAKLNLFHTNISTTMSMLYGNVPRVDVSREHHDPDDDIARVAALLYQRMLQSEIEASGERFPTMLKAALCDRLLPGMGLARVRYELETMKATVINPETLEFEEVDQIKHEAAPIEYVHWQDFAYGWCRTWAELPWCGFRAWLTKEEAGKRFGKEKVANLDYQTQYPTGGSEDRDQIENADQQNSVQKAAIWEIWEKKSGKVFWWCEGAEAVLDEKDDPLGLDGFWPMPMPMMANLTTTLYMAQADFITAQDLYNEVDILQSRIALITRAVKVVGIYDKSCVDSVGRMLKEGLENDMIPVDNWAMLMEKGGLQGVIGWFPVQEIVNTLQVLGKIQEAKIAQLNSITGLSDIMRGDAGGEYTAASSNQLAAKMGSIRVQALQEDFARFASDLQNLRAEVISKHFSPESILRQSAAQFIPEADRDKIQPAVALMQSSDIKWRMNIRPESIAMVDYAQLKTERTEFLTAMATYLQSAQAVVKQIPGATPILLEMLKWGMAGFKGSNYLEGTMDRAIDMASKMPPPGSEQQQPDPMALVQAQSQAELQKIAAKSQADQQLVAQKSQGDLQKIMADGQAAMQEQQQKSNDELKKIMADLDAKLRLLEAKTQSDLIIEEAQSTMAIAEEETAHANTMTQLAVEGQQQREQNAADERQAAKAASAQHEASETDE